MIQDLKLSSRARRKLFNSSHMKVYIFITRGPLRLQGAHSMFMKHQHTYRQTNGLVRVRGSLEGQKHRHRLKSRKYSNSLFYTISQDVFISCFPTQKFVENLTCPQIETQLKQYRYLCPFQLQPDFVTITIGIYVIGKTMKNGERTSNAIRGA